MARKKNTRRKKEEKKEIKKNVKLSEEELSNINLYNKVAAAIGILIFIVLFYLLTLYITNKHSEVDNSSDSSSDEVTISYDNILLGSSLSMKDDQYLVIYYDKSDEDSASDYDSLVSNYKSRENSLKIYTVDLSNPLNKVNTDGEVNTNPSSAEDLVVKGLTLIKVSNNQVVEYVEGDDVNSYLEGTQ